MAVTYADLVAFGFAYVEDNVSTNIKKQRLAIKTSPVPLLSPEDSCPCEEEDFIIFAEFSEVKGPVALFTVPSYIQHDDKIDVNSFIMRIMSVDYQANPGGQFCVCEDTQILQTHISRGRHAYVHYFTLYDLHARGFVRPLCIAYVSLNYQKLHKIFPHLREHFLKVTESIKVNNRQNFKSEILSVLNGMGDVPVNSECSLQAFQQYEGPSSVLSRPEFSRDHQMQQYEDFSLMLNAVDASLVGMEYASEALDHWHSALTFIDESPGPKELQEYLSLVSKTPHNQDMKFKNGLCMLEKQLRPIPTLCPWGIASALAQLLNVLENFSSCELSAPIGSFPALSSAKSNNFSHWTIQDSENAWEALGKNDFLQLLQAVSVGALEASSASNDEQGCDSTEVSSSKEGTSGNEGSSSYHSFSDSNFDPIVDKFPGVRSNSFNSLHESSSDFQLQNGAEKREAIYGSFHTINDDLMSHHTPDNKEDYHSVIDSSASPQHSINSNLSQTFPQKSDPSKSQISSSDSSSDDSESFHDILEALHSDDNWSIGSNDELLPLGVPWRHCLWTRYKPVRKAGHRLLKFFWTFRSAAQHVIFSLLTGRTLVLTGDALSERRVLRIMSAVSPLVPPLDSNGLRVLRWHQGILVSAHIASYQLIGMCIPERLSVHDMISPRDKNSVTILDVNTEQLMGPAYGGHLLSSIGNNVCDFPSDHSLLLFMESVFTGIGRKLQAYKAIVAACEYELPSHACRQLDLHGCDADIIRYLSKLSI